MKITANGVTALNSDRENSAVLTASGTFDGGTLTIGQLIDGTYTAFVDDASFTGAFEKLVTKGVNVQLAVELTGATSPDIDFVYSPLASRG